MIRQVTPLYAGLLAIGYLVLSVRVILARTRARVPLGHGDDRQLERAIRAHANFAEYVPLALVLLLTAELSGASPWLLHAAGIALCLARAAHAWVIAQEPENIRLRPVGVGLTFLVIGVLAAVCVVAAFR